MSADLFNEQAALAKALEACPTLQAPGGLYDAINNLGDEIRRNIAKRDTASQQILVMVQTCVRFGVEGVDRLLQVVGFSDRELDAWEEVEKRAAVLKTKIAAMAPTALAEAATAPAERMQSKFALVIGISHYEHGQEPNQELLPNQVTNLKYAADDAKAVYEFLKSTGNYVVDPPLVNEKASRRGILKAIDELRKKCDQPNVENPTVVIFFSGHGARDAAGRGYIVPYDAERDNLFATALWNKTFDSALDELRTNRLVIFIDACHAATIGEEGVKDAELLDVDPLSLVGRGAPRQRHVVASCGKGQRSLELDGHGIFTHHLLRLLRCEDSEYFNSEEIDLWDVFRLLQAQVRQTASEKFDGAIQEPYSNLSGSTGIVVAINKRLRDERIARTQSYFETLCELLPHMGGANHEVIRVKLEEFLEYGTRTPKLQRLYDFFTQSAARWTQGDTAAIEDACQSLAKLYDRLTSPQGSDSLKSAATLGKETVTPDSGLPSVRVAANRSGIDQDQFAPRDIAEKSAPAPLAPARPPAAAQPLQQGERRRFSREDCEKVMASIMTPMYFREAGELQELLMRPDGVGKAEVTRWLMQTRPRDKAAQDAWDGVRADIAAAFEERWPHAEAVEATNALALQGLRGKR